MLAKHSVSRIQNAYFEKIEDIQIIMAYGVMSVPALVINEKVKVFGRILGKDEIKKYIEEEVNGNGK